MNSEFPLWERVAASYWRYNPKHGATLPSARPIGCREEEVWYWHVGYNQALELPKEQR